MQQFISTKEIYNNFKKISQDVMNNGTTYIVLKHSKPAYKITPLDDKSADFAKYDTADIHNFIFKSKNTAETSLATSFKKYIY